MLLSIAVTSAACGARTNLNAPCPSAPIDPVAFPPVTFVGQPGEVTLGWALDVTNDAAYFAAGGTAESWASGLAQTSLARAPLGGGEPEPFATDATYVEGRLAHDASYLYFPNAGVLSPSGVYVQNVVAAPLHGGPSRTLDAPPPQDQPSSVSVASIATNGDAGVFWLLTEVKNGEVVSGGLLAHWDGAATTTLASFPELTIDLAVSATQAFVLTSRALYSVPLPGGAPVELRAWPTVSLDSLPQPQIVAISDQALFYSLDATSIVRRDIGSGDERTIASGLTFESNLWGMGRIGWADSSWVYFFTGQSLSDLWTLSRVKVDGGEVEILWDSPTRPPSLAVVGDACSIYWLTASAPTPPLDNFTNGPSILMYRRK